MNQQTKLAIWQTLNGDEGITWAHYLLNEGNVRYLWNSWLGGINVPTEHIERDDPPRGYGII